MKKNSHILYIIGFLIFYSLLLVGVLDNNNILQKLNIETTPQNTFYFYLFIFFLFFIGTNILLESFPKKHFKNKKENYQYCGLLQDIVYIDKQKYLVKTDIGFYQCEGKIRVLKKNLPVKIGKKHLYIYEDKKVSVFKLISA